MNKQVMISYIIFLIALFSSSCSMGQKKVTQELQCLICGEWVWEKNDERHDFSLEIYKDDKDLIGKHCYVLNSGDKMDCSVEDEDISFKIEDTTSTNFVVEISSFYSGEKGKVEIKLIDGKLHWKLLEEPKREYYLPKEAVLSKESE